MEVRTQEAHKMDLHQQNSWGAAVSEAVDTIIITVGDDRSTEEVVSEVTITAVTVIMGTAAAVAVVIVGFIEAAGVATINQIQGTLLPRPVEVLIKYRLR